MTNSLVMPNLLSLTSLPSIYGLLPVTTLPYKVVAWSFHLALTEFQLILIAIIYWLDRFYQLQDFLAYGFANRPRYSM